MAREINLDELFTAKQQQEEESNNRISALIVLNRPIENINQFESIWNKTSIHLFADGGANRVYDLMKKLNRLNDFIPNYLTGDFDSLRNDVLDFYKKNEKTNIVKRPSQYQTDFGKCIDILLENYNDDDNNIDIIAFGALGGRVDQSFHSIFQLYQQPPNINLYLFNSESLTFLLQTGESVIHCPLNHLGPTCGIIPVGFNDTIISTNGLRWDVTDWQTCFQTQVSTNNILDNESVWVKSNRPIVFTVEIRKK